MRDLILKMSMSLDGLVARPHRELDWMFRSSEAVSRAWTVDAVSDAGLHIMGSRTFREMSAHWPTSTDVFAPPMNQIPKAVFSKRGSAVLDGRETTAGLEDAARAISKDGQAGPLQAGAESWTTPYIAGGDLAEEVARLKAQDGKRIVAHGGASFARSLIAHGLVDQFILLVHPVILGQGLAIFSDVATPRMLKLVSSTAFPAGAMAQVYRAA